MEQIFSQLMGGGQNTVEKLVSWILKSKLGGTANNKNTVTSMFKDVPNPKNVELSKFTAVIEELASTNKLNLAEVKKKLVENGGNLMASAVSSGIGMLKKKLFKK